MKATMFSQQKSDRPNDHRDGLEAASGEGRVSGDYEGRVLQSSLYTRAMLSDVGRVLPLAVAGAAIAAIAAIAAARRH
jgi:hypothetical protein